MKKKLTAVLLRGHKDQHWPDMLNRPGKSTTMSHDAIVTWEIRDNR